MIIPERHRGVLISAPGLSLLASFALRHCYGQKTAAAHAVIAEVLPIFSQLPTSDQAQIRREIQAEMDYGNLTNADDWERLLTKTKPSEETKS